MGFMNTPLGIHVLHPALPTVQLRLMQPELDRFEENLNAMTLTPGTSGKNETQLKGGAEQVILIG